MKKRKNDTLNIFTHYVPKMLTKLGYEPINSWGWINVGTPNCLFHYQRSNALLGSRENRGKRKVQQKMGSRKHFFSLLGCGRKSGQKGKWVENGRGSHAQNFLSKIARKMRGKVLNVPWCFGWKLLKMKIYYIKI